MAIKGFNESTLATSEIFADLNNINGDGKGPKDKAIHLIKTAKHLTNEDIEPTYIALRQVTDTLTKEAMLAFDENKLIIIFNDKPKESVNQALPFMTFKQGEGYKTYLFMDKYITIKRDGSLGLQSTILRDFLIGALISNGLKRNYDVMASNQYLQNIFTSIYVKFFMRIINREFSIGAEKNIFDTLQYWVGLYFLKNVMGANDTIDNLKAIAAKSVKYIDSVAIEDIHNQYVEADPKSLESLLELLKTASPRMKSLNKGTFISDWMNYYYIPSLMAIDVMEYFIFMVLTLLSGNNIINISASDIVKEAKGIKDLKGELLKIIQ